MVVILILIIILANACFSTVTPQTDIVAYVQGHMSANVHLRTQQLHTLQLGGALIGVTLLRLQLEHQWPCSEIFVSLRQ